MTQLYAIKIGPGGKQVLAPVKIDPPAEPSPEAVKPGMKTSEAFSAIIGTAISLAAAMGWITPESAPELSRASAVIIGQVGTVLIPTIYGIGRTAIKMRAAVKKRGDR